MNEKLRIALVAFCPVGGVARYIELLAREYRAQGHTVTVCIREGATASTLRAEDYRVVALPDGNGPRELSKAYRVLSDLVKGDIDLVHANSSIAGVVVGLLALTHPGSAFVFSPHCFPFATPIFSGAKRLFYRIAMRSLLWVYDLLICCCVDEWQQALRCVGNDKTKTRLVYHGTPLGDEPTYGRPPVVVCVSRLVPGKGLDTLVRAARRVVDVVPEARFLILGDGPLYEELALLIESLGLGGSVQLVGHVSPVEPWLDKAGVFCLPSESEALPFSVLEAMSRGLPIVATDVGGISEVTDGIFASLVEAGDADALACALLRFVSDPVETEQAGRNARRRATDDYSVGRMAAETMRCYREIISPPPTAPPRTPKVVAHDLVTRFLDIVLSLSGLLLLSPVLVIFCLAVLLDGGRPVFYNQPRIGRNGRLFTMYKLRSMHHGSAERWGDTWESDKDPRVTRTGRILRKLNIDELPQLVNVLRGDMSLVGPRPESVSYVRLQRKRIPGYEARHLCVPGLTGWAQLHGYRGRTSRWKRLRCDLWQIRHRSAGMYLALILLTGIGCLCSVLKPLFRRVPGSVPR